MKEIGSLFGTSGIRGVVGKELTPEVCLRLGESIGNLLPVGSKVCLATDTRVSRDLVKSALISGLLSSGINVTDLGILPTPALAFLGGEPQFDAGIMLTASHNPPEYNGIKLFNGNRLAFSQEQEKRIEQSYWGNWARRVTGKDCGSLDVDLNGRERYFRAIRGKLSLRNIDPVLKLVIDPGNGAAANFASLLFKEMGFSVVSINDEPDGLFPGRGAEPSEEALQATIAFLRHQGADLAICFDGDADRVVFCDAEGFLGYNEMIAFISRLVVQESRSKKVVTTVETGGLLDLALAGLGVEVVRDKVGDANVACLVEELDAAIGVEQVGVYIMPQMGYYPDSFFAALFLLSQIKDVKEIREFCAKLPPLFFQKSKLACPATEKRSVMERVGEKARRFRADKVDDRDGLRLDFEDSWLLIRASGTEPVIRVIAESTSRDKANSLLADGISLVKETLMGGCHQRIMKIGCHCEERQRRSNLGGEGEIASLRSQ